MDAVEYQTWRNRMCMEYSQYAGCEGSCPLAGLCTPEDGQGHEEEAVRAVECYREQKGAVCGEYAHQRATGRCMTNCMNCPIGQYIECTAATGRRIQNE